jgi:hypothetical protein
VAHPAEVEALHLPPHGDALLAAALQGSVGVASKGNKVKGKKKKDQYVVFSLGIRP